MFICLKCGKKLKTLHERVYGDRPHYVPAGYHCETCRIYYDVKTNKTSQAVYGAAKVKKVLGGLPAKEVESAIEQQNAYENHHMRSLHRPYAISSESECENESGDFSQNPVVVHETRWTGWDLNPRPCACEAHILPD